MVGIRCPKCKKNLVLFLDSKMVKVFKCACSEYPAYKDIIYLIDDRIRAKSLDLIRGNHKILAVKTLFNLPYKLFLPLYFLTETGIAKILGYKNTIRILSLLGYDPAWSKYLISRIKIPYYQISSASIDLIDKRSRNILDLGCGTGYFLSEIAARLNPNSIIGADYSFVSLFLAGYFFNNQNITYICCDIEKNLPFGSHLFDFIHVADTLQYIKNKRKLLRELSGTIKKTGILALLHTHKKDISNIKGTNPAVMKNQLRSNGFRDVNVITDNDILINLNIKNLPDLNGSDAFNIFASKSQLPKSLMLNRKRFILVSPHLDDAVLSASSLINKLTEANLKTEVITVFTAGDLAPYTPQGKDFLRQTGFNNPKDLFGVFKKEDTAAMKNLGINFSHLDFIDAAFRKDKKGSNIYLDSQKQFSGIVSGKDSHLIKELAGKIKKHVVNREGVTFFVPLGVGGHVDHVIVRKAVESLKRPVIYWEDYPYNTNPFSVRSFFAQNNKYRLLFKLKKENSSAKQKFIRTYKSQMKVLFPDGKISSLDEKFYTK